MDTLKIRSQVEMICKNLEDTEAALQKRNAELDEVIRKRVSQATEDTRKNAQVRIAELAQAHEKIKALEAAAKTAEDARRRTEKEHEAAIAACDKEYLELRKQLASKEANEAVAA